MTGLHGIATRMVDAGMDTGVYCRVNLLEKIWRKKRTPSKTK